MECRKGTSRGQITRVGHGRNSSKKTYLKVFKMKYETLPSSLCSTCMQKCKFIVIKYTNYGFLSSFKDYRI
jgi:hypothetical protein